jgi:opacity protein-like surface antigen
MKKHVVLGVSMLALLMGLASAPAHAQDSKINLFAGYSFGTNNLYDYDPTLNGYGAAFAYNLNKHIALEANFTGHNGTSTLESEAPSVDDNGYVDILRQDMYTYTFGPKISQRVGNFTLFTHFLVGGAHVHEGYTEKCTPATGGDEETCSSSQYTSSTKGNGFAFKTGGGVDWNHGIWGIRFLEVDYVRAEINSTENQTCSECTTTYTYNSAANDFELATGFTVNLK